MRLGIDISYQVNELNYLIKNAFEIISFYFLITKLSKRVNTEVPVDQNIPGHCRIVRQPVL